VYRKAIGHGAREQSAVVDDADKYKLEMTFSRGLYSGGCTRVKLSRIVSGHGSARNRGPFVGAIRQVGADHVEVEPQTPLSAGDGVVI